MVKRWKRTNLLSLPILPFERDMSAATSYILDSFVRERKAITRPEQLRPFIKRWRSMWLLSSGYAMADAKPGSYVAEARKSLASEEVLLLNGKFDAKRVFGFLTAPDELLRHVRRSDRDLRVAGSIALPRSSLIAFRLADYYLQDTDIGFVRLYLDTYPHLQDEGRPFRDTPRWSRDEENASDVAAQ